MNPSREVTAFEEEYLEFLKSATTGSQLIGMLDTTSKQPPEMKLRAIGLLRRLLDDAEEDVVKAARAKGLSWSSIAQRLGRTKQAVWQSYGELRNAFDPDELDYDPDEIPKPRRSRE